MLLTVAICTRDRPASVGRLLASLAQSSLPTAGSWEVLVVDNAPNERTAAVARPFERQLPLRLLHEPVPGLARARNAAVVEARGNYMLWTDDDCVVDRLWFNAYIAAFYRWPDAALFGGPIIPQFEGDPPSWLRRVTARVGAAYAARDLGTTAVALSLTGNLVPFGANYAIRTREQRGRLYDERIGRGAALPVTVGEESEVLEGLLRDGALGWWVPEAKVVHCIPPERQRIGYLRDYYVAYGAYEEWRHQTAHGEPAEPLRSVWREEIRYQVLRRIRPPESWIDALIAASMARGRTLARRALGLAR